MNRINLIKLNNKIVKRLGNLPLNNLHFNITFNTNLQVIDITVFGGGTNSFFWIYEGEIKDNKKQIENVLLAIESDNYENFVIATGKSL